MSKVVGIDKARKACPHCGRRPPCPDFTCKRIARVYEDNDGIEVTYVEDFDFPQNSPQDGDEAA